MKNYLKLEKEIERVCQINNVINILNWDIAVNIPLGSVSSRGEEIATLSLIAQQILKSNKIRLFRISCGVAIKVNMGYSSIGKTYNPQ